MNKIVINKFYVFTKNKKCVMIRMQDKLIADVSPFNI